MALTGGADHLMAQYELARIERGAGSATAPGPGEGLHQRLRPLCQSSRIESWRVKCAASDTTATARSRRCDTTAKLGRLPCFASASTPSLQPMEAAALSANPVLDGLDLLDA